MDSTHDKESLPAQKRLEALLLEGLESGEPIEVTPEYWHKKRARLFGKHESKKMANLDKK